MNVEIHWRRIGARNERWQWNRCLYSYLHPKSDQLLYIGKADGATVRSRFSGSDKRVLFEFLEEEHNISSVRVAVGALHLEVGYRISRELVADIESLLIKRVRPIGNISAIQSRTSRPGLCVECLGHWPHARTRFVDIG